MPRLRPPRLFNKTNVAMLELDLNNSQSPEASAKSSAVDQSTKKDILPLLETASCRYDAIDQDRIEELSKAAKQFYDEQMRIKREARRRDMIFFASVVVPCSVVAGAIYWLYW
ncbi:hypothetical protein FALCPG4_016584 [Fusarium falciforme]